MRRALTRRLLSVVTAGTRGLRRVRRPATDSVPAFDLHYVRTGPRTSTPTVIIPGGPGLGSVLPYGTLRRIAARGGLDLIMVEHRGIGLSRLDLRGEDLPVSAMWIDDVLGDIAAVLEHERVDRAFIVGSSYGSYLASGFGVRYPERVAGMLLDSALQTASDLDLERRELRGRFWSGSGRVPTMVRALVYAGEDQRKLLDTVRAAFELGGNALLEPLLHQRLTWVRRGRSFAAPTSGLAWRLLEMYATRDDSIVGFPGIYEFDLAGAIGFRELGYGSEPDGQPLDPALTYAPLAPRFPAFAREPFDLPTQTSNFAWPIVVLSGDRDLRTPTEIANRVVRAAQDATHVHLKNGHSALDTHPVALLNAIRRLVAGQQASLPGIETTLDRLPKRGIAARLPAIFMMALRVERLLGKR